MCVSDTQKKAEKISALFSVSQKHIYYTSIFFVIGATIFQLLQYILDIFHTYIPHRTTAANVLTPTELSHSIDSYGSVGKRDT